MPPLSPSFGVKRLASSVRRALSVLMCLVTASLPLGAQQAGRPAFKYSSAQWEELRKTAPGTEISLARTGEQQATVLFLTADDSSLTVLDPRAAALPRSFKSLISKIAVSDPDLLLGKSGNEFRDGDLSVRAQGLFVGDRKVADLSQIVEKIDRGSVEDFSVGSSPTASKVAKAARIGIFALGIYLLIGIVALAILCRGGACSD